MDFELTFEELEKKLKKVLNPSRFRFVVILYPNTNMIKDIKNHIKEIYPDSLVSNLNTKNSSYQEIAPELYKNDEGFVYIDDFEEILNNPNLYNGFNQRRDKIASYNINLICFISLYQKDELYKKAINVIPDLWEFKNTVLELEKDDKSNKLIGIKNSESSSYSSLGGLVESDKKNEINNLLNSLEDSVDNHLKVNILNQIATIYKDVSNYDKALEFTTKEIKLKKKLNYHKDSLARSYNNKSILYQDLGKLDKAIAYQEKAIEIRKELYSKEDLPIAINYGNIGEIYRELGNVKKALEYQEKALEIRERVLGEDNLDVSQSYNNIALIYFQLGEIEKAIDFQKKSILVSKDLLSESHPDIALRYNNLSEMYREIGKLDDALQYQEKSLEIRKKYLGDKHTDLAQSYNNLALVYLYCKDKINAKKYIDIAVDILKYNFPKGHPSLDSSLENQKYIENSL